MEPVTESAEQGSLLAASKLIAPEGGHIAPGSGKTLVLVDGHSLAYRMHFALERTDMRTADNHPTWAVYGFFNALFTLLKNVRPEALAVSFDVGRVTFRNDLYPAYKAHRDSMPDVMRLQMEDVRQAVELLGIPIFEKPGYEADDVLGTLACRASGDGFRVRILTGDQDAFQLVDDGECAENPSGVASGRVEVLLPPRLPRDPMKSYDRQAVFEKWGVYPEQVVDFKGLKGDTSDNIPGVPGVGDKTAAKLLAEFGDLDAIYARIEELPANKLREKLVTYRDQAFLSRQLATIDRSVPMEDFDWQTCHLEIPDKAALLSFWERMEFKSFIRQSAELLAPFSADYNPSGPIPALEPARLPVEPVTDASDEDGMSPGSRFSPVPAQAASPIEAPEAKLDTLDGTLRVEHQIVTTIDALQAFITNIRATGIFAIDVETTGLDVHSVELAGIALSVGSVLEAYDRPAVNLLGLKEYPTQFKAIRNSAGNNREPVKTVYIPLHQAGAETALSEAVVLDVLGPVMNDASIVKIVHNAKFEVNIFRRRGIPINGLVFDTMIASYVDFPDRRHGLKSLAEELLGWPMGDISKLIGTGRKMIPFTEVPLEKAAAYAACDTWATWELAVHFLSKIKDERQWTLFYEVEMPLALVLANVEWTGVALDTAYLSGLSQDLATRLAALEKEIWELAGGDFNLNSPKQVGEVLFERLGIAPTRKTKSKSAYSTDVKVLELLAHEHEIVRKLLEYRQLFKLKSTYIDSLPQLINASTNRLHTSFNQAVTATGRLSSSNPNLQNIPIRSELGRRIREAFVPGNRAGWSLLSADYSQIELRLLAHFSEDPNLVKAFRDGEDVHTATASLVFGLPIERVSKEQRYQAKTVNFGVIYGQSPYGLSQQLKIPMGEAAQFIRLYFSRYGNVEQFIESIKAKARETGYVETLAGRLRNLSRDLNSSNRSVREFAERAAFNTPLQGSAADLMKIAMIRLQRKLRSEGMQTRMILQVHDELVLEVPHSESERAAELVRWAMELDQPLRVPLVVDVHTGPSWIE